MGRYFYNHRWRDRENPRGVIERQEVEDYITSLESQLAERTKEAAGWKDAASTQRQRADTLTALSSADPWRWMGDGTDDLESLTCPILITPSDLRSLLAERDHKLAAYDKAARYLALTVNGIDELDEEDARNELRYACGTITLMGAQLTDLWQQLAEAREDVGRRGKLLLGSNQQFTQACITIEQILCRFENVSEEANDLVGIIRSEGIVAARQAQDEGNDGA